MRIGLLGLAVGLCVAWSGIASAQAPLDAKCIGAKIKCAVNKQKGLTGCNAKAEKGGLPVDPFCVSKVTGKFTAPLTGCMEKAETKIPCRSSGDAAAMESKIDAFVADIRGTLYLGGIDLCSAAKDKCVTNYVKGMLGCISKGITTGLGTQTLCTDKVLSKYNTAITGCMAKADLKAGLCQPSQIGNTAVVQGKMDAFIADVECELSSFPTGTKLDITTGAISGNCGLSRTGGSGGTLIQNFTCGRSYAGDGLLGDPAGSPGAVGALTRYVADPGAGTLSAATAGDPNTCSNTGCPFGPARPVPNATNTSSCVLVKFTAPATGSVNTCHGTIGLTQLLQADIYVTGNMAQPCPLCVGGVCDATAFNPGATCTNAGGGLSYECIPAGLLVSLNISNPVSGTGKFSSSATAGKFCPSQVNNGCFGALTCDYYEENGSPAGKLTPGAHAGATATTFCIPATGNGVIDGGGGFPGPGANSGNVSVQLLP